MSAQKRRERFAAEKIGERIKARRLALGLTQVEVSEKSGVAQNHLSMVETGKAVNVKVETLWKIAHALECSVGWLVDGE